MRILFHISDFGSAMNFASYQFRVKQSLSSRRNLSSRVCWPDRLGPATIQQNSSRFSAVFIRTVERKKPLKQGLNSLQESRGSIDRAAACLSSGTWEMIVDPRHRNCSARFYFPDSWYSLLRRYWRKSSAASPSF